MDPRAAQHVDCVRTANSMMAVDDEIRVARQRIDVRGERRQRNQSGRDDVRIRMFVRLANIDEYWRGVASQQRRQFLRRYVRQRRAPVCIRPGSALVRCCAIHGTFSRAGI